MRRALIIIMVLIVLSMNTAYAARSNSVVIISINDRNKYLSADTEDSIRITVYIREWEKGQDRKKEQPKGPYAINAPIELTTSMGKFSQNNSAKYKGKTNSNGELTVSLKDDKTPGMAVVTAKALNGTGISTSIKVPIVKLSIKPGNIVINKNTYADFECRVQGPDSRDNLYYIWSHEKMKGCLQPRGSDYVYVDRTSNSNIIRSPYLKWRRYDGREAEGYLKVEVFMMSKGEKDISLGVAKARIQLEEYKVVCALAGRVVRKGKSHSVKYGFLIPRIEGATGYGVIGTGFNDPAHYGTRYSGGIFLGTTRYPYIEEEGGFFVPLTSSGGSGSASEKSDQEMIEKLAKRFEGGVFYAWPNFGPSSTYKP